MDSEVSVHDPVYIVRKRLGKRFDQSNSREDVINRMEMEGEKIDNSVLQKIYEDYQREIEDVLSDMDGHPGMEGGPPMMGQMDEMEQKGEEKGPQSNERMQKFMRVSSLQLASEAYPVFKSIVVN